MHTRKKRCGPLHRFCADERGGILPLSAISAAGLVGVLVGGIALGTLTRDRLDAQRAADVAAQAAAEQVREWGLSEAEFEVEGMRWTGEKNQTERPDPIEVTHVDWQESLPAGENAGTIISEAHAQAVTSMMLVEDITSTVTARAQVYEHIGKGELKKGSADAVLVMDYSGSMSMRMDNGQTRSNVMEAGVGQLLNVMPDTVGFGAVLYSRGLKARSNDAFSDTARDSIRGFMNAHGPGGTTNTGLGIETAVDIFQASTKEKKYVVLISDGCPSASVGSPLGPKPYTRHAAAQARAAGLTVVSLQIGEFGTTCEQLMREITGNDQNSPDPDLYHKATTAQEVVDALKKIAEQITGVGCASPELKNPEVRAHQEASIRLFYRDGAGGDETRVSPDDFVYNADTRQVEISDKEICKFVAENEYEIVIRYNFALLLD